MSGPIESEHRPRGASGGRLDASRVSFAELLLRSRALGFILVGFIKHVADPLAPNEARRLTRRSRARARGAKMGCPSGARGARATGRWRDGASAQ